MNRIPRNIKRKRQLAVYGDGQTVSFVHRERFAIQLHIGNYCMVNYGVHAAAERFVSWNFDFTASERGLYMLLIPSTEYCIQILWYIIRNAA